MAKHLRQKSVEAKKQRKAQQVRERAASAAVKRAMARRVRALKGGA